MVKFLVVYFTANRAIGLLSRVFTNGPRDQDSITSRHMQKTQNMVLDAALLNTHHYKVRIKAKVNHSREWSSAHLHLGVVAIEKGAFGSPSTTVANSFFLILGFSNWFGLFNVCFIFLQAILWFHVSKEGATPFPELLHFTLDTYLILLRVKQGGIKYHFKSIWYDAIWDWTQLSQTIGDHSKE